MDKPIPKEILDLIEWAQPSSQHYDIRPKGFKPQWQQCEDCGETVKDRRIVSRLSENAQQERHFKTQCKACGLYKNPLTGAYDMDTYAINCYYINKNKHQK